jgi:hypothetical protein
MNTAPKQGADAGSTLAQTVGAVLWSFFGVRRSADLERDSRRLNPVHVIATGIVAAALFVGLLVLLVNWVVGSGVAT